MKPWKIVLLTAVAPLLSFAVKPPSAQAFCIYNKIDKPLHAEVPVKVFNANFSASIPVDKSACCNWKNGDCNPSKKQDSTLDTEVAVYFKGGLGEYVKCGIPRKDMFGRPEPQYPRVKMQGGGYLTVVYNPAFRGSLPTSAPKMDPKNPAYLVQSWSHDHKLLGTYNCPWTDK